LVHLANTAFQVASPRCFGVGFELAHTARTALRATRRRRAYAVDPIAVVMLSLAPILWESGIGSDVMKPIAAPIVGGMVTSTIHVLILVPVFFAMLKEKEVSDSSRN
jgi:Cu/Ag efflux pump CusA